MIFQARFLRWFVVFVVLTVWLVNLRNRSSSNVSQHLFGLMVCYVALSAFSLMLLPLGHILNDFWLFGWEASARQVANATPNSPLYALGGFNRLLLYSMLSFQLAAVPDSLKNFKLLFAGIFSGAVFLCDYWFVGFQWVDLAGVVSLRDNSYSGYSSFHLFEQGLVFGIYPVGSPVCFNRFLSAQLNIVVENNVVCFPCNL